MFSTKRMMDSFVPLLTALLLVGLAGLAIYHFYYVIKPGQTPDEVEMAVIQEESEE